MQILSNFFTGTENLFKLLFINGLLMILIGLFYPLQKRDELELKVVEYNNSIRLLNNDILNLKNESEKIKTQVKYWNGEVKEIDNKRKPISSEVIKKNLSEKIQKLKVQCKELADKLQGKIIEQDKKIIQIQNERLKIKKLESQQQTYDNYCKSFLYIGSVSSLLGFTGWAVITFFIYNKEYYDYIDRRNQNTATNTSANTSFNPNFKIIFLTILNFLLIVMILILLFW